jgi:glutamine amidotransferase
MTIAVVRYNAGNIRSVTNALERIGVSYAVTGDRDELREAERILFPGVGEASSAMAYLRSTGLDQVLRGVKVPVLGICLGLQLLCAESEEGNTSCLGLLSGRVTRFTVPRKVPHTGWSQVTGFDHPIFAGIPEGSFFHFVHSYRLEECADTVARCTYGEPFSAAAAIRNFVGVQFHPEKSAAVGERLLTNFSEWTV